MEYRTRLNKYKKTKKKLIRINNRIRKRANRNLLRLESVYGEMLTEAINSEYDLLTNLEVIENLIMKLGGQILTYDEFHETHGENIAELQDKLNKLGYDLANVSEKVEDILLEVTDY